ncbi:tRNA 2-thiouridine(34) synthase MnmA [Patescibacteria group bacterium]|nr:tRNA 2-thiouridine(34) synthase MnmA [Patescibacteria group bacterium]
MIGKSKKVYVGLSGGVDSAVSAALLKQQGYEVTGVFIKGWYPPGLPCSWAEDRRDAMRVAARLRIPFHTLDASLEYKKGVIDYLLAEYARGRTPNPDVMCNREVKFGVFYEYAKKAGADFIATGHYAQTHSGGRLLRGNDPAKDQSYFLWAIEPEPLAMTLFPVGGFVKGKTRELAKSFNLPVAEKRDSQGICFLGSISVEEFLRAEFGTAPGKAVDTDGNEVGIHDGVLLHTLGERISLVNAAPGPWYVSMKRILENVLVVSHTRETEVHDEGVALHEVNWFSGKAPEGVVEAQYRYHGPIVRGEIDSSGVFRSSESFPEPVAAGQSMVLYRGEQCLGGGIIG